MQRTVKKHLRCQAMVLLACLLPQSDALSGSTVLAPKTNTGLQNIQLKEVQCNDQGLWSFDIVNNAFVGAHVEYFFGWRIAMPTRFRVMPGRLGLHPRVAAP